MADNTELQIGDVAPEFTAFDSEGNSISVDVSKTLESNKELLEHPFYN